MARPLSKKLLGGGGWALALVIPSLVIAGLGWWGSGAKGRRRPEPPPSPAKYVDNGICLGCHADQGREWQESHHAQAMAAPTEQTVRGDFTGKEFKHRGVTSRFFKRDGKYFVSTEGGDGRTADFEVKYTFGVSPLQQYLIEMPGGRLQPLTIAWDVRARSWFHILSNEETPPGDVLHWTGRYQTANTMCLVCHTTQFEKRYDSETDTFASRWAEPNVSCQECHGPGDRHVQWETSLRGAGTPITFSPQEPRGLTVDIKASDARRRTEFCAPCHSRRSELVAAPKPGDPLLDNYLPSLLVQGLYHADGQQLEEVYVDGSFRQSLMFQKGVTCTNCHQAHTGKLKLPGNAVCLQCHRSDANPSFPSAMGNFDTPSHHFHKDGSTGAQCAACHMPATTYMRIQSRPDHSIRVPRPDLFEETGAPDACTNCHQGRNAPWAADAVARWYGPKRRQETHYGEAFKAARSGEPSGNAALARLIGNPQTPPIVRASALAELRHDPATGVALRIQATGDKDPEVRVAAADSLEGLPGSVRVQVVGRLLTDPVRAVRITAARNLSALSADQMDQNLRPAFEAALAEYIAAQNVALDMPGAHFNLAVVYENTGRGELAERHYQGALRIDPDFTPARANLARLYSAQSRNPDAERVLVEGLKRMPQLGDLQYSLGLLLAEEERMSEAVAALAQAARLLPDRASVQYNYGLALQQLGRSGPAEAALLAAQRLDPDDPAMPYALALLYAQTGRRAQGLKWAERLRALRPQDPQTNRLIASLRGR